MYKNEPLRALTSPDLLHSVCRLLANLYSGNVYVWSTADQVRILEGLRQAVGLDHHVSAVRTACPTYDLTKHLRPQTYLLHAESCEELRSHRAAMCEP